ncbi:Uncharacterised protein [Escherichia coli]|uniref:Uncharacterized protein n=1 Tax=Escherichia coli TaxID=562 RepID=A0A485JN08_ECOLX|nr:Uncharacterised protein [Escherichia coli]
MLPARALRTNGGDLKLTIGDSNMSGNHNHEGCCQTVKFTSRLFLSSDNQITPS